jgi:hypothetical protein
MKIKDLIEKYDVNYWNMRRWVRLLFGNERFSKFSIKIELTKEEVLEMEALLKTKRKTRERKIRECHAGLDIKPFYRLSKKEKQAKKERLAKMVKLMAKGELARSLESGLL